MLLVHNGVPYVVDDYRVHSEHEVLTDKNSDNQLSYHCSVYVDGIKLMDAIPVYIDHKQYKDFMQNYEMESIKSIFGDNSDLAFYDMGTKEVKDTDTEDTDTVVYKDYSKKAYEGISYFSDIISDDDRKCTFKQNYKRVGVRL